MLTWRYSAASSRKRKIPFNNQLKITIDDVVLHTLVKYDGVKYNPVVRKWPTISGLHSKIDMKVARYTFADGHERTDFNQISHNGSLTHP